MTQKRQKSKHVFVIFAYLLIRPKKGKTYLPDRSAQVNALKLHWAGFYGQKGRQPKHPVPDTRCQLLIHPSDSAGSHVPTRNDGMCVSKPLKPKAKVQLIHLHPGQLPGVVDENGEAHRAAGLNVQLCQSLRVLAIHGSRARYPHPALSMIPFLETKQGIAWRMLFDVLRRRGVLFFGGDTLHNTKSWTELPFSIHASILPTAKGNPPWARPHHREA